MNINFARIRERHTANPSRTALLVVLIIMLSGFALTRIASAGELPNFFNYQGRLTSPTGVPVADGSYPVKFSLFTTSNGGTAVWSETDSIQTLNGTFAVMLGKMNTHPPNIFNQRLWLAIKVDGKIIGPRSELGSVAFAMTALNMPDGTIQTVMIASRAVTADKLANSAVTTRSIAKGAVTEDKLAPGMVVPVGSVISWWGNSDAVPDGWQYCNGSSVTDDKRPLKGFDTPDLRNRFVRGAGGDARNTPQVGGQDSMTLTVDQMPAHSHGVNDPGHSHQGYHNRPIDGDVSFIVDGNIGVATDYVSNQRTAPATTGISIQSAGGGQPFATLPSYVGLIYIIRIK